KADFATPAEIAQMDQFLARMQRKRSNPVAVFLGAGASKPFGYPLTGELLFKILHALKDGGILQQSFWNSGKQKQPWKVLRQFLQKLLPNLSLSRDEMPMVTGVLSLLDFSLTNGQALLPRQTLEQ